MNVEMNVSVVDLSANQKKLQVQIPAMRVQEELDEKYRDLAKRVRIKGFRPGKVPRNIIKSYYGKNVENELSSQFIEETFQDALREADLKPLVEADVSEVRFEDNGAFTYVALVDVSPPFELEEYKALTLHRPAPIEIDESRVEAELERLQQQYAQLLNVETGRAIEEGDVVLVDFIPTVDGVVFEKGKANDYMVEVGKQTIHPEFDQHLIGHQSGESIAFELDYPEDTPTREVAGKRVHFDVTIREIKEKLVPALNDEFAKEVGQFETLEDLRKTVRERVQKHEAENLSLGVRQQIIDQLLGRVNIDLSSRVIEREVDRLIGMLQYQFESQGLKVDTSKFNTPDIRAEYRPQAEKNVRWRLLCEHIANRENLGLTEQELEEIYREVARVARTDIETVKRDYTDLAVVHQAKERKLQDKVLKMLEGAAVLTEAPEAEKGSEQE